ncbi:MAG: hypothetical protein CMK59_06295 [Proteobacteria bacterium]|nr:hypothetical protein [Pseudomonadota bacterium]
MARTMLSGGFPPPPPFTKNILIGLIGLYIIELLGNSWVDIPLVNILGWWPGAQFEIWQPLTCYLIQGKTPLSALLSILMVYFFFPTVQRRYGKNGLLKMCSLSIGCSTLLSAIFIVTGAILPSQGPFMGILSFVTAAIVVFGLTQPNAQILLFFILPIKAAWIAWGSGLLTLLNFLAFRSLEASMICGGWLGGYLFVYQMKHGSFRKIFVHWNHKRRHKRLSKFTVIDGGKNDTWH